MKIPYSPGAPGCSGRSQGEPAGLPAGFLGLHPGLQGWVSSSRQYPAGGNPGRGGQSSCQGPPGDARNPLQPRAAARHGPAIFWGVILGLVRQLAGAIRGRRCMWPLGSPEGPSRAADLRARWPAGLPGARLALGFTGFPALLAPTAVPGGQWGCALPGSSPRKARMSWGLPSCSHVWALPRSCCLRNVWTRVPCIRSGPAMGIDLGRVRWPGGIMSEGVLGSGGSGLLLGLGGGRTRRLRHTGIQDELVAREPGPRGSRARSRRMLRKGVDFPSREGAPRQGISDGLRCCLASWRPRTPLCAEVEETYVVESAPHAKPPAIVLGGVVPDGLVATFPLAPPSGLVRLVPFGPGSARPGGTPKATTARAP